MNTHRRYTLNELADAAKTTPRTIRYYTAEGLLPPPDARSRVALYSDDHLLRLRLIARLKAAHLPLSEIRSQLAALSTAQIAAMLDDDHSPPDSAVDYIARLLPQPSRVRLRESSPGAPSIYSAAADQVLDEPRAALPPRPPVSSLRAPFGRGQAQSIPDDAERWRRVVIAPGVELHLREPLDDRAAHAIDHLRRLFDDA